jgi:hypothetical protein
LRDYLDEFISAYLDDILVFINGGPAADVDHRKYIQKVLERLHQTGIQLDMHSKSRRPNTWGLSSKPEEEFVWTQKRLK